MASEISPDVLLPVALQLFIHSSATWPKHLQSGSTLTPEQSAKILARDFASFYWELSTYLRAPATNGEGQFK